MSRPRFKKKQWRTKIFGHMLHSDVDAATAGEYVLSGEGAASIFTIDENTGDIHATKRLDREAQAYYTLQAQAVDRVTNLPVEPRSEFVVKVQDINDNEPKFLDGPYVAGVPEMSPLGRCVEVEVEVELEVRHWVMVEVEVGREGWEGGMEVLDVGMQVEAGGEGGAGGGN
ncbi:hypothetical protein CRUP_013239 [Coryphaenoides rupestris]|nr:hypothetical protein CRUP_013239 [Coryphaenoides rupestris]